MRFFPLSLWERAGVRVFLLSPCNQPPHGLSPHFCYLHVLHIYKERCPSSGGRFKVI